MNKNGELYINGMDAFEQWGILMSDKSLSSLIEPEPLKDPVTNKSSTMNGKQVRKEAIPKVDERDITLFLQIYAASRLDLFTKLKKFKTECKRRRMVISTRYEEGIFYRCDYKSCTQYRSFHRGMATFSLRLNEPNPANRGSEDVDRYDETEVGV